jgi:hypothetical protein
MHRMSDNEPSEQSDPDWFRDPNRRERWIAAGLFVGFGVFFILLFIVLRGWWFRWVILGLSLISILNGLTHVAGSRNAQE